MLGPATSRGNHNSVSHLTVLNFYSLVWCPTLDLTIDGPPSPPRQAERGAPFSPQLMKMPRRATRSPKGERGLGGEGVRQRAIVKFYAGHHSRPLKQIRGHQHSCQTVEGLLNVPLAFVKNKARMARQKRINPQSG